MAVIFSKSSNLIDDTWNEWAHLVRMNMQDADNEKNDDDALVKSLYQVKNSKRFGEKTMGMSSFGSFMYTKEGENAQPDTLQEVNAKLITHSPFMKEFVVTAEAREDGVIDPVAAGSKNYVRSYKRTRAEFATAALCGEGTTFDYGGHTGFDRTTADGKALFAKDHSGLTSVAAQSNVFTNAFGDDDVMLDRLANIGFNFMNASGQKMGYVFDTLVVPGNCWRLIRLAKKIINSDQQINSSFNDVNVNKGIWKLVVNPHWIAADETEPYIIMSSKASQDLNGSLFYDRIPLTIKQQEDVHNHNLISSGRCRFSAGFGDWRHVIMGGATAGTTLT